MKLSERRLNLNHPILKIFSDFILPRFCLFCEAKLGQDEIDLCPECYYQIKTASPEYLQSEFERKFSELKLVNHFHSAFVFEKEKPLQAVIHQLKYAYRFKSGIFLGKTAGTLLAEKLNLLDVHLLLPVPIHKLKKYDRGYNQTFYIAKGFSETTGINFREDILVRNKNRGTQSKLKLDTRRRNISGVFSVRNDEVIIGKNVAIVDDIVTTGATMNECAKVLKEKGAAEITALSLAVAG